MDDSKNKTIAEMLVVFILTCSLLRKRLRDLKLAGWSSFASERTVSSLSLLLPLLAALLDNA